MPVEYRAVDGPRDGDLIQMPDNMPNAMNFMVLHCHNNWQDGEDDHLPPSQRMRALYAVDHDTKTLEFLREASIIEIGLAFQPWKGDIVAVNRHGEIV